MRLSKKPEMACFCDLISSNINWLRTEKVQKRGFSTASIQSFNIQGAEILKDTLIVLENVDIQHSCKLCRQFVMLSVD